MDNAVMQHQPHKGRWIFKNKEQRMEAKAAKEAKKQARLEAKTQAKSPALVTSQALTIADDIYEKPSATQQNISARLYWDKLMQNHPGLHFVLSVIGSVVEFFFGGHFVVWAGRKVVLFSGRTAESALLFAALWISAIYSAHDFMVKISFGWSDTLTSMSILAFTLLPEIVLFSAIITCVEHWYHAIVLKRKGEYIWAALYSLPTLVFFGLAVFTFTAVIESQNHTIPMASGLSLVIRAVTSWVFALIGMVHAGLKKRLPHILNVATPVATVVTTQATVESAIAEPQVTETKLVLPRVHRASTLLNLSMLEATQEGTLYENWPAVSEPEIVQDRDTGELEKVATKTATTVDDILATTEDTNTDPELVTQKATPKVTKKLDSEDTEEGTKPTPKRATNRGTRKDTKPTRATAKDRALRVLKVNPNISPAELQKKAKISPSYAKRLKKVTA